MFCTGRPTVAPQIWPTLSLLCFKHHDDVHLRGWKVVRVDGQREVLVIPPEPLRDVPIRGPGPPSAA